MMTKEMVLFESSDGKLTLPVQMDGDTVWLSQKQMAELFGKDQSVISRHIKMQFLKERLMFRLIMQKLHIKQKMLLEA